jgi:acetyl/propionyl-CoA carboxylase alpha subunit
MRRALGEYEVAGIKTTLPFFTWLFTQPEFIDGRFHTTYLDDVLRSRNGRRFAETPPDVEEIAVIAAAIQSASAPSAFRREKPAEGGLWRERARTEGLR